MSIRKSIDKQIGKIRRYWERSRSKNNATWTPPKSDDLKFLDDLKSVALFLGPYRNLTTLTASILFLHPNCQVLNHAGKRVFRRPETDFLTELSEERFNNFCHFAYVMSRGGRRGQYGGSILYSHAFADHEVMQRLYRERYGRRVAKRNVQSIVWKESLRIGNLLKEQAIDFDALFTYYPRLRFIMPIRNPIDCAISNQRTQMSQLFSELKDDQLPSIIEEVIKEEAWFLNLEQRYPKKFFHFFENEMSETVLRKLAKFLELDADEQWINDGLEAFSLKPWYAQTSEVSSAYRKLVKKYFGDQPKLAQSYETFLAK